MRTVRKLLGGLLKWLTSYFPYYVGWQQLVLLPARSIADMGFIGLGDFSQCY
jgi:hypothetical protein